MALHTCCAPLFLTARGKLETPPEIRATLGADQENICANLLNLRYLRCYLTTLTSP
jgi:hypothetical protein